MPKLPKKLSKKSVSFKVVEEPKEVEVIESNQPYVIQPTTKEEVMNNTITLTQEELKAMMQQAAEVAMKAVLANQVAAQTIKEEVVMEVKDEVLLELAKECGVTVQQVNEVKAKVEDSTLKQGMEFIAEH